MINSLGKPQSLLLLGGTSDIALSVARRYAEGGGLRVVLAARPTERRTAAAAELSELGCAVTEQPSSRSSAAAAVRRSVGRAASTTRSPPRPA